MTIKEKCMYRQGDVLLVQVGIEMLTSKFKKQKPDKKRVVLAYGEVTGHAHVLPEGVCTMYAWEGTRLIEVTEETNLTHEEHSAIAVAPGIYRVIHQREYTPQEIRRVAD